MAGNTLHLLVIKSSLRPDQVDVVVSQPSRRGRGGAGPTVSEGGAGLSDSGKFGPRCPG